MPMIENEDSYYYDFYGLEERVTSIGTQVSEVHEDVKIVEIMILCAFPDVWVELQKNT